MTVALLGTYPPWQKNDSLETQEICTQYNALKLARSLFRCVWLPQTMTVQGRSAKGGDPSEGL